METRVCRKCGQEWPLEFFPRERHSLGGRRRYCKNCHAALNRAWRVRHPGAGAETRRAGKLRNRYGISLEKYNQMLAEQEGKCKTCGGVNKDGKPLYVDHNHNTGEVRGLLCQGCNTALGMVDEDEFRLIALADYLLRARLEEEFALAY